MNLDLQVIREKRDAGTWNWEHLMRQLSLWETQLPDGTALQIPLHLRNRQRIWRVLEEARVRDVADEWEKWNASFLDGKRKRLKRLLVGHQCLQWSFLCQKTSGETFLDSWHLVANEITLL